MSSLLIKNGRIISPADAIDKTADILIENGRISGIGFFESADKIIDASGLIVSPGLVDMHVHLRDPGFTHKEDILTGCEAAAAGGVTSVLAMPNTNPVCDSLQTLEYIYKKARSAKARVYQTASITKGLSGKQLCCYEELKQAGAAAISDDGRPVENAAFMQAAMKKAYQLSLPVISHCEDLSIIDGGLINKGDISEKLGIRGMDRSSEDSVTAREIAIAEADGTAIHIAHVSTYGSLNIIKSAKKRGAKVTCETCPHYFMLTDEKLLAEDADYRMNPPLRTAKDVQAVTDALFDGTIDCIVTDHAPHTADEKADFVKAPNGVVGLETSLAAALTELYHKRGMPLGKIIELMSVNPAKILGIPAGTLKTGAPADITIFDPDKKWTVIPEKLHSKSKNSVFKGMELTGQVKYTILNGEAVYEKE